MENRFGLKDLFIFVLLIGIALSIWISMLQRDRQLKLFKQFQSEVSNQTEQINWIRNQLSSGVVPVPGPGANAADGGTSESSTAMPLFPDLVKARQQPDFAEGDALVWPLPVALKKLTPFISSDVYQRWVEGFVMQSLASYNAGTGEWEGVVAESWTESPDGLTYTFKLRRGVRFSDGSPLTAKDVVFTYNWVMNPKVDAPRSRAYFDRIQEVRAEDDYTVVFQMREPYFMGFVTVAGMEILSEKYYSQFTPEEFSELPGLLFGSGPYRLEGDLRDWKPGSGRIQLVRNSQYWAPRPGLDRIIFTEITDETARQTALGNGEVDMLAATPQQYLSMRDSPSVLERNNMHVYDAINGGYRYIGWNQMRNGAPTRFADVRVRQAMSYLIDRNVIADRIMVGLAKPATGPFHPLGSQADPSIEPYPYDLEKGKALLAEAGYMDRNGDGIIENASGEPFRFTLTYPSGNPSTQEMVTYVRDALARAGIAVNLDPGDWTIIQQRLTDRGFDAITLGWGAGWVESDVFQMFHSSQIADGGDNSIHYVSERFDELVTKARVTMDPQKRQELWREVHRVLHEEQPYAFLTTTKSVVFIDKRFKNVRILPTGIVDTVMEWYVPADQQKRNR